MSLIGITGAMGAGKTTVLRMFAGLGAATWDADAAVHGLYRRAGPLCQAMVQRWGPQALTADGDVDRAFVGHQVFHDPGERQWLESLVHPQVRCEMETVAAATAGDLWCAVPLLFEVGWAPAFRSVICVWCDESTRRHRLRQRGMDDTEIGARTRAQMHPDEKLQRAHCGLANNGSLDMTRRQCLEVWRSLGPA